MLDKYGLTADEVKQQKLAGNINKIPNRSDKNVKDIIIQNTFTYFNAIFFIITILVIATGSYRNLTFLPVVIGNMVIGIIQELRAKKVLDELSLLDKTEYIVIRDGKEIKCISDELVLSDLVFIKAGQQIPADGYVVEGITEVNESLLTGEADEILKQDGSELKSGSYVVSGECYMTLTAVGENSYAAQLMKQAKVVTDKKSEMIRDIETIIKISGIMIIPVGIALFLDGMFNGSTFTKSILSMVSAVIGMIPEGMYLLTTVALALSAARLAKKQVLLHDMRSIETLARVDILCVDKTGTITNEKMTVKNVFEPFHMNKEQFEEECLKLNKYIQTINDGNITMQALRKHFIGSEKLEVLESKAFSSKTKYSEINTPNGKYRLGAPEILLNGEELEENLSRIEEHTKEGQRVLAFVEVQKDKTKPLVFISLENEIRENAKEIFSHFAKQGVETKVISGDHPLTVSIVAKKAGIGNAENYVDAGTLDEADFEEAVKTYTVFGRVKPEQKRQIVEALQQQGKKVAMTGDGVNDILAMKTADCSIAMGGGSDAARQAAQVVLMDSDFSRLKNIVSEGRRDINNITRSATLFLYKNMFSLFLAVFSVLNSFEYPLQPSQVSLISMFNIGIPSFFLALEPNEKKQEGRFLTQTLIKALPAALTSFFSIAALVAFARLFELPDTDIGTASTYLLAVVGFIIFFKIAEPINKYRIAVFAICIIGFLIGISVFSSWFGIESLSTKCAALCAVFALAEVTVMHWITKGIEYLQMKFNKISMR